MLVELREVTKDNRRFGFREKAETPTGGVLAQLHLTEENALLDVERD